MSIAEGDRVLEPVTFLAHEHAGMKIEDYALLVGTTTDEFICQAIQNRISEINSEYHIPTLAQVRVQELQSLPNDSE